MAGQAPENALSRDVLLAALLAADDLELIGPVAVGEAVRDASGQIVDFRLVAINRRGAADLRRPVEEVVGGTWSTLFPGLLETDVFDAVKQVVETGHSVSVAPSSGFARVTVSGEPVALESQFERFRDGYLSTWADVTDRVRATRALSHAENRYERLLASAQEGIWIVDDQGITTMINNACSRMMGLDPAEVEGRPAAEFVRQLLDAQKLAFVEERLEARARGGAQYEFAWPRPDGSVVQLWVSSTPLYRADGSFEASLALVTDVTALREAELRYRLLAEHSTDLIRVCDPDDVLTYVSPAAESVLGYPPEQMVGRRWHEFMEPDDASSYLEVFRNLGDYPHAFVRQARFRRADGVVVWLESAVRQIRDPETGHLVELQASSRDVTERVRTLRALEETEERSRFGAVHDALTSLPNRKLLVDRLTQALARSRRSGSLVGVLFVDIDHFKYVNDSLGHEIGDQVLIEVGRRITAAARAGDTVARFGGDEYVIVCEGIAAGSAAVNIAERVDEVMRGAIEVNGQRLHVTVSTGIALDDSGRSSPGELLRHADLAMYRAKERGRNRWEVFDSSLGADASRRLRVETELRDAVESGQIVVHYQPIADLGTGEITGVEALVRWQHPARGLLLPAEYLDIAEDTGLIVAVGSCVINAACQAVATWSRRQPERALTVAVNISFRQLVRGDLAAVIDQALAESGLDARLLRLELTETALFDARDSAADLTTIDRLGIAVGIDDFGTGYSSLADLKRFPVRFLKIDASFVKGLGTDAEDTAIVEAIITLGRTLGLEVVAEGVETVPQLEHLRQLGCTSAQGYLLARPVPFEDLATLLLDTPNRSWPPTSATARPEPSMPSSTSGPR